MLVSGEYPCPMQQTNPKFNNDPAYGEDGRLVIKSTCKSCGASQLVSVRDGTLAKWESQHECPDTPKTTLRLG
jgi:hypothetical protein